MKKKLIDYLTQFYRVREKLNKLEPFKKGSINKRWQTCGTPNCSCKKDPPIKHGPYDWWTWKEGRKTKSILVPPILLVEVNKFIANYKSLKKNIKEMEKLSELIIRQKINHVRKKKK